MHRDAFVFLYFPFLIKQEHLYQISILLIYNRLGLMVLVSRLLFQFIIKIRLLCSNAVLSTAQLLSQIFLMLWSNVGVLKELRDELILLNNINGEQGDQKTPGDLINFGNIIINKLWINLQERLSASVLKFWIAWKVLQSKLLHFSCSIIYSNLFLSIFSFHA